MMVFRLTGLKRTSLLGLTYLQLVGSGETIERAEEVAETVVKETPEAVDSAQEIAESVRKTADAVTVTSQLVQELSKSVQKVSDIGSLVLHDLRTNFLPKIQSFLVDPGALSLLMPSLFHSYLKSAPEDLFLNARAFAHALPKNSEHLEPVLDSLTEMAGVQLPLEGPDTMHKLLILDYEINRHFEEMNVLRSSRSHGGMFVGGGLGFVAGSVGLFALRGPILSRFQHLKSNCAAVLAAIGLPVAMGVGGGYSVTALSQSSSPHEFSLARQAIQIHSESRSPFSEPSLQRFLRQSSGSI